MSDYEPAHFSRREFACSHTGEEHMDDDFLRSLDSLREKCGFPFFINSGYRDPSHPEEAKKDKPGQHSKGVAADIAVKDGIQRRTIVQQALKMGFGGIGVAKSFVHVDSRVGLQVMWTY